MLIRDEHLIVATDDGDAFVFRGPDAADRLASWSLDDADVFDEVIDLTDLVLDFDEA